MPSAKDVTPNTEFLKCFLCGDPGSGKSVLASSFPTPGFLFDFGSQVLTYRGLDFDYEQYEMGPLGWIKFEKDLIRVKKEMIDYKYMTIVVDDMTGLTDLAMERALQLDPKRSKTEGPIWNVHYAMVKNLVEGRIRQIMDLSANIVVISHMSYIRDEETGAVIGVEPMLTGQLSIKVPSYFDEVYYTQTRKDGGQTKWYVQTIPIGFGHGRSRLSGKARILPDLIPNEYSEIMAYALGTKKKSQPLNKTAVSNQPPNAVPNAA